MSDFTQKFALWLLLGIIIISFGCVFAANLALEAANSRVRSTENLSVQLASQYLAEELSKPASHIRSVAILEDAVQHALQEPNRTNNPAVTNAFRTLLLRNPDYLQARWITEEGIELVRVERTGPDHVYNLPAAELQDKRGRSYVRFARELSKGEIYVSPLDLNIEQGEIQVPYVPVVRVAIRSFAENGQPAGIFVLNIGAQTFLDHLTAFTSMNNLMLLNEDGFWLKGLTPDDEWGFMVGHKARFTDRHPDAWQAISEQPSGQIETGKGLWTWDTVSVQANAVVVKHNIALKVVTVVAADHLGDIRLGRVMPVFYVGILLILFYAAGLHRTLREMENRRVAEQDAIAANQAKSSFLATMSHEIRTPMTGVIGLADMLAEDDLPEDSLFKVRRIRETARALLSIINDILDLSKLDAGRFVLEKINFRPLDIANDVVRLFYMTCPPEKKGKLTISANVADDFPDTVCADPTRLRQILVNLVGNAVKFTDEGSVSLNCSHNPTQQRLHFEVVDTGIGMTRETVNSLFQDFMQADASISRKYHGTGLGLAVCKRLVQNMGGEIGARSVPGKGSRFFFWMPYEPAEREEEEEAVEGETPESYENTKVLSVLVAEDNAINQIIIRGLLAKMGHNATFVGNGQEAVDAVQDKDFDLVLMDVRMPAVSGPDATKMIRQLHGRKSNIPVIALTADLIAENKSDYLAAGMNDCVGKPIDPEELEAAIMKAVTNRPSG